MQDIYVVVASKVGDTVSTLPHRSTFDRRGRKRWRYRDALGIPRHGPEIAEPERGLCSNSEWEGAWAGGARGTPRREQGVEDWKRDALSADGENDSAGLGDRA